MMAASVEYHEPQSLEETWDLIKRYGEDGRIMAGGTAVVLLLRQRLLSPLGLINIQRIAGLDSIEQTADGVAIGALVTHAEAQRSPMLADHYAALAQTFAKVATPRIRNAGTVGGNLAHGDPHLDPPVTLLALDARVTVQCAKGSGDIALSDFFRDYYETALRTGDILTRIYLPARPPRSGLSFIKFLPRSQDDYAAVDVAAWIQIAEDGTVADARLAFGSVGPIPFRAMEAEKLVRGQRLTDELLAEAGELAAAAADPEDDVRGSPAYKRELIKVLLKRAVAQAIADVQGDA